jgi:CubicO group peptidase (beta-lactamase class C family)
MTAFLVRRCGALVAMLLLVGMVRAAELTAAQTASIDSLFARWDRPDSPGCAVALLRDGATVYSRGYGFADIDHGIPITPNTLFHIGSVGKQFTAFAIHWLANEGKLSLDDDVRQHVPELHDFGTRITLRQLLHHTSGLRDYWHLLYMTGLRSQDEVTADDILRLILRQRRLNFTPGVRHLYSNTGYHLLALIAERVAGEPLGDLIQRLVLSPLQMSQSQYQPEHGALLRNRAASYFARPAGYRAVARSFSSSGAAALWSSVEDLAKWDANFYDHTVGGEILARMQQVGRLNDGRAQWYASGLLLREYRGTRTVEHYGEGAGFRTALTRFPELHFSVVLLCNASDAHALELAQRVADVVLDDKVPPVARPLSPPRVVGDVDVRMLDALVGTYEMGPDAVLRITRSARTLQGQLTGYPVHTLLAASARSFFSEAISAQLTFETPVAGKSPVVILRGDTTLLRGERIELPERSPKQLAAYAGTFYSEELETLYTVSLRDDRLFVRHPRGEKEMLPAGKDSFIAPFPVGRVQFTCVAKDACGSFAISTERTLNVRFERVNLKSVSGSPAPVSGDAAVNLGRRCSHLPLEQELGGVLRYAALMPPASWCSLLSDGY